MYKLLNEIGDDADSRGTLASVSRSIGVSPVVANVEGSRMLAESGIRVRELNEEGGKAGVLADSGNNRVSDGRWGVGARVGPSDSADEAVGFSAAAGESEIFSALEGGIGERECV